MEHFKSERRELAVKHFEKIKGRHFDKGEVVSLVECVGLAFEHNLDIKVADLSKRVADKRVIAETLGMLPVLQGSYTGTARDNDPGASSENIKTGRQSLVASKSSERFENLTKVELIFSVLDFGLAFLNSEQAKDKSLAAEMEASIARRDLALDVAKAYFRVAAAQYALRAAEPIVSGGVESEKILRKAMKAGKISPLRALDEIRRLNNLCKLVLAYRRGYVNAKVELNALIGNAPTADITVDDSMLDAIIVPEIPLVDDLERVALLRRPELSKLDMEKDIVLQESRKTIVKMFPNVQVFVDFTNSSNKFLYSHSWWEIGIRAAYNLFKLPRRIMEYRALLEEMNKMDVNTMALSVGVLSQIRIAHANILEMRERFDFDSKTRDIYAEYLRIAEKNTKVGGSISKVDISRLKLELAEAEMDRAVSLGNYYLALQRLIRVSGVTSFKEVDDALKEWDEALKAKAGKEKPSVPVDDDTEKGGVDTIDGSASSQVEGVMEILDAMAPVGVSDELFNGEVALRGVSGVSPRV
jgi:outer membrane protein TolC